MSAHIETRLVWQEVQADYQNEADGYSVTYEPEVLLWHPRYGTALGKCLRMSDGEVITVSAAHGFTYTHFALFDTPRDAGAVQ
jgi:hypothetical protein